jgi:hypothetical protein
MTSSPLSYSGERYIVLSEGALHRLARELGWDSDARDQFVQYAHFEMDMAQAAPEGGQQ